MGLVDLLKLGPPVNNWRIEKVVLGDNIPTWVLGTGTADATTFLRGDLTWAAPPGGGGLITGVLDTTTINLTVAAGILSADFVSLNISQFTNDSAYITGAQVPANETDPVFTAWLAGPPNVSEFTNDVPYLTSADLTGYVQDTRLINTTAPLSGGGDLSADRTITTSMSTNKLIGRATAGTGVMEEIILGTGLSYTGTTLNVTFPSGFITAISDTATVDLTVTGTTLSADVIDNTSIQKILIGSSGTVSGTRDWINFISNGLIDVTSADDVGNDRVNVQISSVVNTNRLVGRTTAGVGVMEEIVLGTGLSFTGTTLNVTFPGDFITAISDTNSVNLTITGTTLSADVLIQNTATVTLSINASGLKADFTSLNISQFTNDSGYLTSTSAGLLYQPLDADLTSIATLGFASTSFLKKTALNTWALDTNTYLTSVTAHDILSSTHGDTLASAVTRGSIIVGNNTPLWAELNLGTTGKILRSDGTDLLYSASTFADTYTASNLLYSNGANTVQGLGTANDGFLITNGSGVPSIGTVAQSRALMQPLGCLTFNHTQQTTPTDGQVVYFGTYSDRPLTTAAGSRLLEFPVAITIIGVSVSVIVTGVLGTTEASTIAIRINGSDSTLISTVKYDAAAAQFSASGLNIAIAATNTAEIKVTYPSWATNPTGITHTLTIWYYRT